MLNELKEQILNLDSVVSVNILLKDDGEIDEIHLIADKTRNPKNLVRDIETLVQVNLNKQVDHKKISIAQLNLGEEKESGINKKRIEIVSITKLCGKPICEVHLRLGGIDFKETYHGFAHDTAPELVARAMIKNVRNFLPKGVHLEIKNLFFTGLNNEILVMEIYWIAMEEGMVIRESLIGTSYIKEEMSKAAGQAFLNAINRKVQIVFT